MASFLIAYDLTEPPDQLSLTASLRSMGALEVMKSVWVLTREGNADSVRESLAPYIGSSGRLFVSRLSGDIAFRNLLTGNKRSGFLGSS
jgi:hypothetical protein